jgi:hypothetical protein
MLDKSVAEVIDSIRARVALPVSSLLFLTAAGVPSLTEARAGKRKAEVVLLLPSWWSVLSYDPNSVSQEKGRLLTERSGGPSPVGLGRSINTR